MNKDIHKLLLRSLDEALGPDEDLLLKEALDSSPELRKEREELIEMRKMLGEQSFRFGPFFAGKVLNKLEPRERETLESWFTQMGFAFQRVGLPAVALVVLLLLTTFFVEQSLSLDVITGTSELTVDDFMTGVTASF